MTDESTTGESTPDKTSRRRPRTRWILVGIAGLLVAAIAGTTWSTAGFTKRGGHEFNWFVEKKIDCMLDEVEASDDQRNQVHAIVKAAVAELQEVRSLKREIRRDLIAVLTEETIDRNELELLRQRKMKTVDRMSQRTLAALADAADVLTHAQRQELAAEWKSHKRRHKHDHKHDRRD